MRPQPPRPGLPRHPALPTALARAPRPAPARPIPRLLPVLTAATLALAACSGTSPTPDPSTTASSPAASASPSAGNTPEVVDIWADPTLVPAIIRAGATFRAATGLQVNVEPKPAAQIRTDLQTLGPQGKGPDLFVGNSEWVGAMLDLGLIAPVDLGAQSAQFRPVSVQAFTSAGQVYGVPFTTENVALLRNTTLAPDLPADVEAMAKKGLSLKKDKKVDLPIALPVGPTGDAQSWYPLYSGSGGYIFPLGPDGSYTTDSVGVGEEGSIRAAQNLAALADDGAIAADVTLVDATTAFAERRSAYLIAGQAAARAATTAGVPFSVEPVPGFASTSQPLSRSLVSSQGYQLSAFARDAAAAKDFLSRIAMTTQAMDDLGAASELPPAWATSYAKAAASNPVVRGFGSVADASDPAPNLAVMDQVWPILDQAELDLLDGASPKSTMTDAGAQIQAIVDSQ